MAVQDSDADCPGGVKERKEWMVGVVGGRLVVVGKLGLNPEPSLGAYLDWPNDPSH